MAETTNIYGNIQSIDEVRMLFRQLQDELALAESRQDIDEVKKRSEYLCTLADNPQWRDEGDRGGLEALELCLEEDTRLTMAANTRSRELLTGGAAYMPWREGDDSNMTRNP